MARVPHAFVIMPYAPEFDRVYTDLIVPALAGYDVARADTRLDERSIMEKIITGIRDADLLVADLTNTNANVMYELGIAHSLGKPTIMMAQSAGSLPFDIRSYPVHEYRSDLADREAIVVHLQQLAASYRAGLIAFSNPVTDFGTANTVSLPIFQAVPTYSPDDFANDVVDGLAYMQSFDGLLGGLAEKHTACLNDAHSRLSTAQWATLSPFEDPGIRDAANCSRTFAQELADLADDFHKAWERIVRGTMWVLSPAVRNGSSNDSLSEYVKGANLVDDQLNETLGSLAELRHVNETFPRYSGNLTHAFDTVNASITRLLNEIMTAKGYVAQIRKAAY